MTDSTGALAETIEPESDDALPRWELRDLYDGQDSQVLAEDLEWSRAEAESFHAECAGRLAEMDGAAFGAAIVRYEAIAERLHKALSYAQLVFAGDIADPETGRFMQTVQEQVNAISTETLFFTLELNRLEDDDLEGKFADPVADRYRPWVRDTRVFRPHKLDDDLERLLHEKSVTGRSAWVRLFEQTLADLRFPMNGDTLTLSETLNLFYHGQRDVRRAAAKVVSSVLGDNVGLFALITNTLAKDKEIEDKWRRYPTPISYRNLSNQVEDEVVDALVNAIRGAYDQIAHRYYRLKAHWFGSDHLDYWDRNAPLPGGEERRYDWAEAKTTVLDAFGAFDPRMAEIAKRFFDESWIDAGPRLGKDSGAFAHPTVPSVHPYVLMNFYGRPRDVMTLAHELGHGVHQVVAADQGTLMADTPLTLAETASVFGEMLVFRALVADEDDPGRRRRLLAGKVEDMLNTVVRQIAFHEFEQRIHEERASGELSIERLGEIWLDVQRESLGPALRFDDDYRHFWAYIPHFVHSPFYVYAYAFGDCLVNSLYQVYGAGHPGFEDKYIDMLRAGGTLRHRDLLRPFGLDAGDPAFWGRGLAVITGLIDELEELER